MTLFFLARRLTSQTVVALGNAHSVKYIHVIPREQLTDARHSGFASLQSHELSQFWHK